MMMREKESWIVRVGKREIGDHIRWNVRGVDSAIEGF